MGSWSISSCNPTRIDVRKTESDEQEPDRADHAERERAAVQEGARPRPPDAVERALDDGEDPRAGPQRDDDGADDAAPADLLERLDGGAQELARAGVDLDDARQRLAAGGDAVADDEQDEERREERQQPEVAHRRGRREEIVLVELVDGVLEDGRPRRVVLHAPAPAREEWDVSAHVLHQSPSLKVKT